MSINGLHFLPQDRVYRHGKLINPPLSMTEPQHVNRVYAGQEATQRDTKCVFRYTVNSEVIRGVAGGTKEEVRALLQADHPDQQLDFDFLEYIPDNMVPIFKESHGQTREHLARAIIAGMEIEQERVRREAGQALRMKKA